MKIWDSVYICHPPANCVIEYNTSIVPIEQLSWRVILILKRLSTLFSARTFHFGSIRKRSQFHQLFELILTRDVTCQIRVCPTCDWKRGRREGKRSIGPWTKYGHTNLISFCAHTNGGCSKPNFSLLFICTRPSYNFVFVLLFDKCFL